MTISYIATLGCWNQSNYLHWLGFQHEREDMKGVKSLLFDLVGLFHYTWFITRNRRNLPAPKAHSNVLIYTFIFNQCPLIFLQQKYVDLNQEHFRWSSTITLWYANFRITLFILEKKCFLISFLEIILSSPIFPVIVNNVPVFIWLNASNKLIDPLAAF